MSNIAYIIGGSITFSPSTESLHLTENPDISVVLTPACNRLLIYLISNQGIVLSRDAIFSTLWAQYGSTPSNSSLNTYMSLIRKAFINLAMESEVITTIPKTGFVFNPDVNVEKIHIAPIDEINANFKQEERHCINNSETPDEINVEQDETKKVSPEVKVVDQKNIPKEGVNYSRKMYKRIISYFVASLMLIVAAVSLVFFLVVPVKVSPVKSVKIGKIKTCDVIYLPVHAGDYEVLSSDDMNFIIKQSGFTCKNGGVFYIYADKRVTTGHQGKAFISYCELRDKSVKNCMDYIVVNLKLPVTGIH